MLCDLGMSALGPAAVRANYGAISGQIAANVDAEIGRLLGEADGRARAVITAHRAQLDELAELLVARETLERDELHTVLGNVGRGLPSSREGAGTKRRAATRPTSRGLKKTGP